MCWVMPPCSPDTTSAERRASSSEVLPWSTWPMDGHDGGRVTRWSSTSSAPMKPSSTSASDTRRTVWPNSVATSSAVSLSDDVAALQHHALTHQELDDLSAADRHPVGKLRHRDDVGDDHFAGCAGPAPGCRPCAFRVRVSRAPADRGQGAHPIDGALVVTGHRLDGQAAFAALRSTLGSADGLGGRGLTATIVVAVDNGAAAGPRGRAGGALDLRGCRRSRRADARRAGPGAGTTRTGRGRARRERRIAHGVAARTRATVVAHRRTVVPTRRTTIVARRALVVGTRRALVEVGVLVTGRGGRRTIGGGRGRGRPDGRATAGSCGSGRDRRRLATGRPGAARPGQARRRPEAAGRCGDRRRGRRGRFDRCGGRWRRRGGLRRGGRGCDRRDGRRRRRGAAAGAGAGGGAAAARAAGLGAGASPRGPSARRPGVPGRARWPAGARRVLRRTAVLRRARRARRGGPEPGRGSNTRFSAEDGRGKVARRRGVRAGALGLDDHSLGTAVAEALLHRAGADRSGPAGLQGQGLASAGRGGVTARCCSRRSCARFTHRPAVRPKG